MCVHSSAVYNIPVSDLIRCLSQNVPWMTVLTPVCGGLNHCELKTQIGSDSVDAGGPAAPGAVSGV